MENFQEQPNIKQEEQTLEDFQQEFKELQENHQEENREDSNPDLMNVNINKLTMSDLKIWQEYKGLASKKISKEELDNIYGKLEEYRETVDDKKEPERYAFEMFMANKINGLLLNLED